jgi:hypothetical protein
MSRQTTDCGSFCVTAPHLGQYCFPGQKQDPATEVLAIFMIFPYNIFCKTTVEERFLKKSEGGWQKP